MVYNDDGFFWALDEHDGNGIYPTISWIFLVVLVAELMMEGLMSPSFVATGIGNRGGLLWALWQSRTNIDSGSHSFGRTSTTIEKSGYLDVGPGITFLQAENIPYR